VRLLLDTHAFLWYLANDPKLRREAGAQLEDVGNEVWLSVGSLLEMSVKVSTGKLRVGTPFTDFVRDNVTGLGIEHQPIAPEHLEVLSSLPFHHKDPFDRLLVAQALSENLVLLSCDRALSTYGAQVLW
jgi:PIN domain nuclease of toxin-antitoxin system